MAQYRSDPFYVDLNLVTSLELQKHLTDYVDVIENFPEELVVSNHYWHTDSHSDPATSKITFYENLNNNTLQVDGSLHGAMKEKTTENKLKNKNIRDQLRDKHPALTEDGDKYGKVKSSGANLDRIMINVQERGYSKTWTPTSSGDSTNPWMNGEWVEKSLPVDSEISVYGPTKLQESKTELPATFGMKDMSPWFILYWIEKFNTAHKIVKSDLIELLGEDNEYFVKFSESVGQLKNLSTVEDNSTLPLQDIDGEAYSMMPVTTNSVAKYCTKNETDELSEELSWKTNKLYRSNLANLQDDSSRDTIKHNMFTFSDISHGVNLVEDGKHIARMYAVVETVRNAVQDHLKGLYDVLELLSNRENYMETGKPKQILLKVEDFTISVDILKNKIKSYEKSSSAVTPGNYGKATQYNYDIKNVQPLAVPGVDETPSIAGAFNQ